MALRGFGSITLSGSAQPAFGTTLTAAITNITPDRYTGQLDPRSAQSTASAVVTSVAFFRVGDRALVGPAAGPFDWAKITAITLGSSPAGTLTLQGLTTTHASGEFVILSIPCAIYTLLPGSGNAGTLYIGEDNTVSATSLTLIAAITATQAAAGVSFTPNRSSTGNVLDTPHLWLKGTSADTYIPSLLQI